MELAYSWLKTVVRSLYDPSGAFTDRTPPCGQPLSATARGESPAKSAITGKASSLELISMHLFGDMRGALTKADGMILIYWKWAVEAALSKSTQASFRSGQR